MFYVCLGLLPHMQACEHRLRQRLWACRLTLSHKEQFQQTASHVFELVGLIT